MSKMEGRRERSVGSARSLLAISLVLLASFLRSASALSVTVADEECIYEFVPSEGDTVSGNFVVMDHDSFWDSDQSGVDLVVSFFFLLLFPFYFILFFASKFWSNWCLREVYPHVSTLNMYYLTINILKSKSNSSLYVN